MNSGNKQPKQYLVGLFNPLKQILVRGSNHPQGRVEHKNIRNHHLDMIKLSPQVIQCYNIKNTEPSLLPLRPMRMPRLQVPADPISLLPPNVAKVQPESSPRDSQAEFRSSAVLRGPPQSDPSQVRVEVTVAVMPFTVTLLERPKRWSSAPGETKSASRRASPNP